MRNQYLNSFSKPRYSGKIKRKPREETEEDEKKFDTYL